VRIAGRGGLQPLPGGCGGDRRGLDGIRNQIEPPPPTEGLAYGLEDGPTPIPPRLEAALDELEKDTVLRGLMARSDSPVPGGQAPRDRQGYEHARDYPADDWVNRVDDFEFAEFFEFL
jgi:hypothetical protein